MSKEATTTGTDQASTGDVREAASAFEAFLSLGDEDKQGEVEAPAEDQDAQEAADTETEASADEDEVSSEAGESTDDESGDEQPSGKLFTVRVDGTEMQVSESELIAGYSRQQDYTRKTQALAIDRKSIEQAKAVLHQQRTEYAALLPKLAAAIEAGMEKEPNWEALRAQDPAKAAVEKQRWDERREKIAAIKQEEERVAAEQAEMQAELANQILVEERQKLFERPEMAHWKDPKRASAESQAIAQTLLNAGFTEAELAIYDHRAMLVAWKASQYDLLTQKRSQAQKQVQEKVKVAPVVKPGGGAPKQKGAAAKAAERLAKTGRVEDAAQFFLNTL